MAELADFELDSNDLKKCGRGVTATQIALNMTAAECISISRYIKESIKGKPCRNRQGFFLVTIPCVLQMCKADKGNIWYNSAISL